MQTLPLLIPSCLSVCGVLATVLVVFGVLHTWLFIALAVPLTAIAGWLCYVETHIRHARTRIDLLVLSGCLIWVGLNLPFHAAHLLTDRDPATYTVTAVWLTQHPDLHIPKPVGFKGLPFVTADSLGFSTSALNANQLYAQGSHLLPALLGAFGKVFGIHAVFLGNIFFGGAALLAFYSFGASVIKRRWAALATLALSVSLPFLFFSRDAYTEPLTLCFVFTSLSWLHHALRSLSCKSWLFTGVSAGAMVLVRPDAYLSIAALEAYLAIHLLRAPRRHRAQATSQIILCASAIAACILLGWFDLSRLSSGYYHDLRDEIMEQLGLIAAVTVLAVPGILLYWNHGMHKTLLHIFQKRMIRVAGILLLVSFFSGLFIRSLLLFGLAAVGKLDTMSVQTYSDGTTMLWLVWYIGPVLALVGIGVYIYQWREVLHKRSYMLLPLLFLLSADCMLYLLDPRISPDQIWASRRFLPIIFPGFILLGALGMQQLYSWRLIRPWLPRRFSAAITGLGIVAIVVPALTSLPFWTNRAYAQEAPLVSLCDQLPANAVVVWVGNEGGFATEPTTALCGVPAVSLTPGALPASWLAQLQQTVSSQHRTLYLAAGIQDAGLLPALRVKQASVIPVTYSEPMHTYKKFPTHTTTSRKPLIIIRAS